jgi:hypothetical protein
MEVYRTKDDPTGQLFGGGLNWEEIMRIVMLAITGMFAALSRRPWIQSTPLAQKC